MEDPLRIPDEKRSGGGLTGLFERPDRGWWFWIFMVVVVLLNLWFDVHHPPGILFDIMIVIIWAVGSDIWSRKK
jgi:hypothetical protein